MAREFTCLMTTSHGQAFIYNATSFKCLSKVIFFTKINTTRIRPRKIGSENGRLHVIEFGLTQSNGLTAYYALDQVRFVAYYKRKGGQIPLDPEMISSEIKSQIENSTRLIRKYVLIIEGDADFLAEWRNSVPEINVQICISTREVLKNLNIKIVDEDWKPGTQQISLNKLLSS